MNCQNCKFNGDRGCAVHPDYWVARSLIFKGSTEFTEKVLPFLSNCPQWEEDTPETLTLTLPQGEWQTIANSNNYDRRHRAAQSLLTEIRRALNWQPSDDKNDGDDIPF